MHSLPINLLLLFFTFGVLLDTRAAAPAIAGLGSSQNWVFKSPAKGRKLPPSQDVEQETTSFFTSFVSKGLIQKHFVEPLLYSDMEYHVHDRHMNRSSYLPGHPFSEKHIKHYSNFHQILLVGEGDFSFSLSLAKAFGSAENMVATSLDSREKLQQFYNSAHETLSELERLGALVLHGVDVTTMEEHHIIMKMKFHRIVYNFPHAGFWGRESHSTVIKKHRQLLKMFFKNAKTMVSEIGEIHVTHQERDPYNKWELVKQAKECGLLLKESVNFRKEDYPGYVNRRGAPPKAGVTYRRGAPPDAGEPFPLRECRTHKFVLCPDILYKREIMAIQAETEKAELKRQRDAALLKEDAILRKEACLKETILELEYERRARNDAETEKAELKRQRDAALLKKDAIMRKEACLKETILELEYERRARNDAETENAELEASLNHSMILIKELKKQRDEALHQKEEAGRPKMQKGMMPLFVSSSVAFALFLFLKCRNKN